MCVCVCVCPQIASTQFIWLNELNISRQILSPFINLRIEDTHACGFNLDLISPSPPCPVRSFFSSLYTITFSRLEKWIFTFCCVHEPIPLSKGNEIKSFRSAPPAARPDAFPTFLRTMSSALITYISGFPSNRRVASAARSPFVERDPYFLQRTEKKATLALTRRRSFPCICTLFIETETERTKENSQ